MVTGLLVVETAVFVGVVDSDSWSGIEEEEAEEETKDGDGNESCVEGEEAEVENEPYGDV